MPRGLWESWALSQPGGPPGCATNSQVILIRKMGGQGQGVGDRHHQERGHKTTGGSSSKGQRWRHPLTLNGGGPEDYVLSHPMGRGTKHRVPKMSGREANPGAFRLHAALAPPRVPAASWALDQSSLTCMSLRVTVSFHHPQSWKPESEQVARTCDTSGKLPTNARSTASEEKLSSGGFTLASYAHRTPLLPKRGEKNKSTPPPQVTTYFGAALKP